MAKCTGMRCPMQVGYKVDECNHTDCPWSKPFYEKFCKDCPAPEYTLDDGRKLCLHECDFKDGKCPYGTDIEWWLHQPAE